MSDAGETRDLDALQTELGHRFSEPALLERALCHSSYANETQGMLSNERMEFLGDAVIGLAVARVLYEAKPEWREGELSRALHAMVDGPSLAAAARRLELGRHLLLGRSERRSGGEDKDSILEDAMEAVFAALYLDEGLPPVVALARNLFGDALSSEAKVAERHPKTRFNERVMQRHGSFPTYRLVDDTEIDDADDRFEVAVLVEGVEVARGRGRTKRAAEREAAERADTALFDVDGDTDGASPAEPDVAGSSS